jgi:serine/threonine-protein kinase RsbW
MPSVEKIFSSLPAERRIRIEQSPAAVDAIFASDPRHLAAVRTAIEALCATGGFDAKSVGEVGLVVNEALANVIRHAYGSRTDRPIHVQAEIREEQLEIQIRDWGSGKCPSTSRKIMHTDPLTPGGLGLVCMHKLMDQVLFTPQLIGMLLTMRRAISRTH